MYESLKKEIKEFERIRSNSPFCRLTLKEEQIDWSTSTIPLAFKYFRDNTLDKIDKLLLKFGIEKRAHKGFINSFKDKAFLEVKDQFKYYNIIWSNIAELLSASFVVDNNKEVIKDLSAWKPNYDGKVDVESEKNSIVIYTEVKYLGEIPEIIKQKQDAMKNEKGVASGSIPDVEDIYSYICMRIADAVFQLEKNKIYQENRRVFLLIDKSHFFTNKAMTLLKNREALKQQSFKQIVENIYRKVLKVFIIRLIY